MKNKFLIFLGIFIFMIIPKNVFALTGSYDLDTSNKRYINWDLGDPNNQVFYTTEDETGYKITNSSNKFYNNWQFFYRSRITYNDGLTTDYYDIDTANVFSSSSNNGMGICSSSCDVDITFDYWLAYVNTSDKINQAKFVLSETYDTISIFGVDTNDELKRFWCKVEPLEIQTNGNEPYYHMQATCNTSNFKTISYVEVPGSGPIVLPSDDFFVTISYFFNQLHYETKTYTGTQDGDGLENVPDDEGGLVEINNQLDNIIDMDLDASDKVQPNTDDYTDYQTAENNLFGKMNNANINNMNIAIDANSSTWVWSRITDFLSSHALLMSFLVSMLSIGIIKMALGR